MTLASAIRGVDVPLVPRRRFGGGSRAGRRPGDPRAEVLVGRRPRDGEAFHFTVLALGLVVVGSVVLAGSAGAFAPLSPAVHPSPGEGGSVVAPMVDIGSATPAGGPVVGSLAVLGTIPVGGLPEFAAYDAANGDVYVPNWANGNVSVVHGASVVATLPAGFVPFSATYDPSNHFVYVVNRNSDNVTVLDGTSVVGNVAVGTAPRFATFDASNGLVYVSNSGSSNVTVLSGTKAVATVSVGADPSSPVVGSSSGGGGGWDPLAASSPAASSPVVYVPNSGSGTVSVIGGSGGTTVLATVTVGSGPQFAAWDPSNAWLYVPNNNSSTVSVLASTSPYNVLYTIPVGTNPFSASYNTSSSQVLVVNYGSDNLSVLGGALATTVVASVPVGTAPEFLAQEPGPAGRWLVPNTGSGNVSVINGTTDVGALAAGGFPVFGTVDPANLEVYVQNFDSANVTVIGPAQVTSPVTFKAVGLPSGSTWSVVAGAPPLLQNNTTVGSQGEVVVHAPKGELNYSITGPAGFAPAAITGPGSPSLTSANVSGPVTFTVTFGPLEVLSFGEVGLPLGTDWSVTITSTLPQGGPAGQTLASNGSSVNFNAVKGGWRYHVAVPAHYAARPPSGSVKVPAHAVTKTIKFSLVVSKVTFTESGLKKGTAWGVNVSGPMACELNSTHSRITCALEAGNYSFVVWTIHGETASPATGTFVVTAPLAVKVPVVYSA